MPVTATARRDPAALIVAAVAGALAVALAVIYFVVVLPDDNNSSSSTGGFTRTEREVMSTAATVATNIQSLTRATFDGDWQRALDGTTGALHSDLAKDKARTLAVLNKNKVDLRADVTHTGLEGPTDKGNGYVVIVTMLGYSIYGSKQGLPSTQRLQLTMVHVNGKWLASDISQRGLS